MAIKAVESLRKGLEILEAFSYHGSSLSLRQITQTTGLPKATAYRLLQTLIAHNYIHYFQNSHTYRLGPRVMSLGFSVLSGLEIGNVAQPYLEDLSQRIEQNVNLGILDGSEVVYIIRIKRHKILGINLSVGSRLSAYNSAIGQAILAYVDSERLESILKELSRNPERSVQIGPRGELVRKKLDQVRENGYAFCDGEYVAGLRSIGVPIFKGQGEVEAAINIPVFSQFCGREKLINRYLPLLQDVGKTISSLRGWDPSTEEKTDFVECLANQL
jgi:IclR family pca regulon transcriptional regulator